MVSQNNRESAPRHVQIDKPSAAAVHDPNFLHQINCAKCFDAQPIIGKAQARRFLTRTDLDEDVMNQRIICLLCLQFRL